MITSFGTAKIKIISNYRQKHLTISLLIFRTSHKCIRCPKFTNYNLLGKLFQQLCKVATEALEQCYRGSVALFRGCWRKLTEGSGIFR